MSRRKDVHIPKVWEADEIISDDDDENIEEMQKAVEDILSKITRKKKTTQVSQETPVQFDIKIEVEEFDEQPSTSSQSHNKNPKGSTSQSHGTTNTTKQNNQNINKIQTTAKQPQQSLLIQRSLGRQNLQLPKSKDRLCQKSISPSPQPNTYRNKNNLTNSQSTEQNKSTNSSLYQYFILEAHNIKSTMQILSKFGNVADNYIYILMKNYENIPTVPDITHVQMALQKVLEVWNNWFLKDPLNRGAPLLYKCKDCGWAWWHLNSFMEHIRNIHERENWKLRFEFEATNGESYIALKISNKLDKSLPAVRIVNAPCWRCGMLPGDKYRNFNTTSLTYHCQCGVQFAMCHEYRLHLDVCPNAAPTVKKLVNYKCYLCFLRFDTPEELQRHRLLSHTVRSDLPASWTPVKKCVNCCMSHIDGISDCPAVKRMVPCGFCTKMFSTNTVMNLHQSFSQENYKCRLCDEVLKRECMEMLHLVKHTYNYIVLLKCMICNSSNTFFHNDTAYKIHLLSKHPGSDQPAMKVPVPLKCLQESGYNVQTLETDKVVVPPRLSHTYEVPVHGNKSILKRMAGPKESPRKRVRKTINSSHENEVNTMDVSEIKVEEDIEDFINTEMEINEMILLNNKDSELLRIKLEDFEDLSEGNKLNDPNNEGNPNNNFNKNNPNTANSLKDKSLQPFDDEINKTEGCDKVLELRKENTEDDTSKKGEEFNIAGTQNGSDINSNKNKPNACSSSKKENCDSNRINLTNNGGKLIKNNNDKLNATANCNKPVKENIILEMRNEADKSNGMLDFELQIQKTIIHSNAACNDPTHVITNVIVKNKTDDNYITKENNTSSKPIHTHEPHKEDVVNSNTEEKELHNSNVEKRSDKEDSVPQNKCVVNQKELNVNTNKDTQECEKNKNITTIKVLDKQGINSSKKNDSHEKDIPIETSINHNVPDKETLDSKLVINNPGPSKTIKVEQDSLIGNDVKIKEEVLDDDTDDEKLVIAEFTDLITDKSVTLEVKAEPQEIFENDMIDWGKGRDNTDNGDVEVDDDRENSGGYITWTPHLGVVRGGVNMEEESDDEDLPLMDIKTKKKKMYTCKRCKFNGCHMEYQEHKKMCVRQKKYKKRFYPEDCDKYECTICEKQFGALIKYLKHLTVHGYQWLQCPECMDNFPTRARLSQHVLHHINKNYVPLRGITSAKDYGFTMQCTQCDDEVQPHEFFRHWERHLASARRLQRKPPLVIEDCAPHSPMLRDLIAILLDRYTIRDDDEHKPLRWCKMCNRPFTRDNECKRHYIEHLLDDAFSHMSDTQGLKCQICGEMWEKCSDFRLHIRTHASMPVYRCELCSKTFSDSSNFAKHRKVHNLCSFTCDKCGKKFNRKISLVEHIKFHEQTQPITCEFEGCSKLSYTQSAFTKHLKLVHYGSKYRCQICKKTLGSNKEMWDHKWQEHRLRKVIADCPICHMQFRKYLDVKKHVRRVHADLPDLKKLNKLSPEEKIGNVARLVHDVRLDAERLNKLSPEENGNVARLVHDGRLDPERLNKLSIEENGNVGRLVHGVILDPESEEDIIKIEIEDI